ncbi:FAD-binding oxidoreductase [Algiphilus aromaticivorans]|uniref:FAD-binding oxidoreductase n=1 Tax=Algiphilus aromaticivorans TaxID=382454 RepID=UPI0005C16447|nr:FAD-linked oxidase C-terminal domain-containing protein [Algiphilus aromaticivorans]
MSPLQARLAEAVPAAELSTDADIIRAHARDQAGLCDAGAAVALVRARSVDTVIATLRVATATRTPVVTRGAGTGLSGGANASEGCILLALHRLDRILELDPAQGIARVEPGVLNGALDARAREHGLVYAPDPASRDISSIGGNVATNAGGACCLKYGVTGDHVVALEAVLADGTRIHAGAGTRKNVAGLDLKRLLIGSEGTLAVIVGVTVRLLPQPQPAGTLIAFFGDLERAGQAIVALQARQNLSRLEVMDQATVAAVEAMTHMELDTSTAAMIIAQADSPDSEAILAEAERLCEAHDAAMVATTLDEHEGRMFMQARSAALPALEKQGHCLLDDVAVPIPKIPELLALCAAAAQRHGITVATFGHGGDGNLHPTIVYDGQDSASVGRARQAFDDIVAGALALGGSITGEHGVGTLKRAYLTAMAGEREVTLMRGIKGVFDPMGILNPGKGY